MRFFTDQFFSEAQKAELLEYSHLVERHSVNVEGLEIQPHREEPVFYTEWQQDKSQQASGSDNWGGLVGGVDLPATLVVLASGLCALFAFGVLLMD